MHRGMKLIWKDSGRLMPRLRNWCWPIQSMRPSSNVSTVNGQPAGMTQEIEVK